MGVIDSLIKKHETVFDKHRTLIYKIRALESEGKIIIHSDEMVTILLSETYGKQ